MRSGSQVLTASIVSGVIVTAVLAGWLSSSDAQAPARPRQLPQYTASGDLVLPKDFHEWVYLGSPLTPIPLNGSRLAPNRLTRTLPSLAPASRNITTSTSSQAPTRSTSRRTNFPKGPSCSRSCSSRYRGRTPTVRVPSPRGEDIFPGLGMVPM